MRARTQKRLKTTRERNVDKNPRFHYQSGETGKKAYDTNKEMFIETLPSLKNSKLAHEWGRVTSSVQLSELEVLVAGIGVLHKAFYAVRTPNEKRVVLRWIKNLSSQGSNFRQPAYREYSKRKTP
ncbi:MAG: hypothetical protein Q7S21_00485 [archaeon]|nr:hypothetical protein [archaeon]